MLDFERPLRIFADPHSAAFALLMCESHTAVHSCSHMHI